jgi:isopentenyl-diphosphate delta-isomerase
LPDKFQQVKEKLVLVDEHDNAIGSCEKLEAHQKGILHRAFSIFIFNSKGELLLQKRANSKYHSAGLWTNTCCGHPRSGEDILGAAMRRLKEEMGFSCELTKAFHFTYNEKLENGLIENEYDHVFFGEYNSDPMPDPLEASAWKFVNCDILKKEIKEKPEQFTIWFRLCFDKVYKAKFG